MGVNKSPLAFDDAREIFERAINAPRGIRVRCPTPGAAVRLRARLNRLRDQDRKANMITYAEGEPMYGVSIYDRLEISIPKRGDPDDTCVFLKPRSAANVGEIEELTE